MQDIECIAIGNDDFRRVLYPFFRVEAGQGVAVPGRPFPPLAAMQRGMADRRKADRDASKAPAPPVPASAATGR